MKNINKILFALALMISIFSCKDDVIDQLASSDFAPGVLTAFPSENGSAAKSKFEIKLIFVDGAVSPLSKATIILSDDAENEVMTVSKDLSGTLDSIMIEKAELAALDLAIGTYNLSYSVEDTKGQSIEKSYNFSLTPLDFPANNLEMYMAGSFNGWGWDSMILVGDNLWELKEVTMDGGEWKFKNTKDWTDKDWGDTNCNGKADVLNDANTNCDIGGLVNITFNDATLAYTVTPSVSYEQNISSLYLLGTINNFSGTDYEFMQTADNTWFLEGIKLMANDLFKFSEKEDFSGISYGDNDLDGKAEAFGTSIQLASNFTEGIYNITFNDKSREYTFDFVKYTTIGIIGSATPGGWDADTDMTDNGDGTFSIDIDLVVGEAKFRNGNAWDLAWGGSDFPTGTATTDGGNIAIAEAATYNVVFNPTTGEYTFTAAVGVGPSIYLVGAGVPDAGWGWDTPIELIQVEAGIYQAEDVQFANDAFRMFATNGDWGSGTNYPTYVTNGYAITANLEDALDGDNNFKFNGTPGAYNITLNENTKTIVVSFGSPKYLVGAGVTAAGWSWDTPVELAQIHAGVYEVTTDFVVDAFRVFSTNGDWGTGTNYPTYIADGYTIDAKFEDALDGDNNFKFNATAGRFTMTLDDNVKTIVLE